jgi:hypothetical protein
MVQFAEVSPVCFRVNVESKQPQPFMEDAAGVIVSVQAPEVPVVNTASKLPFTLDGVIVPHPDEAATVSAVPEETRAFKVKYPPGFCEL